MIYVPGNHLYSVATPNSIISIKGSNVHYQSVRIFNIHLLFSE